MADSPYTDLKRVLAQVFDPFMHVPGTVTRRNEVIRLGKKLRSLLAKPTPKKADALKLSQSMQRVTMEQIRQNALSKKQS